MLRESAAQRGVSGRRVARPCLRELREVGGLMCCDNPLISDVYQDDVWIGRACQNCGWWEV